MGAAASVSGAEAKRRIRVCLVAPALTIPGGQAIQAARLYQGLCRIPSLDVGFVPTNPALPRILRPLQRVRYLRTIVTVVRYVWTLLRSLAAYDVVHVFSASYWSFVLNPTPAVLLAKLYRKKVILNYRSGEAEDHLRRWGRTAIPVMRQADALVVSSGFLMGVFARAGLRARMIPNIIDFEQFRFRERRPLRPRFLANRHLEPLYNVACVLRAFARIQRAVPDARLVVAGEGSQRAALEQLARELGLRHCEFVGRVRPDRMPGVYDAADIYLNAPDVDNMPGSILEAFASGVPVVTTDAGGIPFILRHFDTGLLVPRGDDAAMATAALQLLDDPALAARLTARAFAESHRLYAADDVLAQWLRVYESLSDTRAPISVGVVGESSV